MIGYGSPPASDEIEIAIFGPGYGEAIALHIGDARWLLVDSCINPDTKNPATEEYLNSIGVDDGQVDAIVVSHWHDDHVRGMSSLASRYTDAVIFISTVFNDKDAKAFLAAYGGNNLSPHTGGAKELFSTVSSSNNVSFAGHRTLVIDSNSVRVTALSPMPGAMAQSVAHFAQYIPKKDGAKNYAPEPRTNFESIVLHVDFGNDAILLGSDLEEHVSYGWSAVASDRWSGARRNASVYKVAHHGSNSGECSNIWSNLLQADPIISMTPWALGGKRLPTVQDKRRLKTQSSNVYISSGSSNSPQMDINQLKRLKDIAGDVRLVDGGFGMVRHRKKAGSSAWSTELFGSAQKL